MKLIRPLVVLSLACAAFAQPPAPKGQAEAQARATVDDLVAGRFAAVEARFDERVSQAMPPGRLQGVWEQLSTQVGAFRSVTGGRQEDVGGRKIQIVTCAFEKAAIDIKLVLDEAGRISGLFFAPAAQPTPPPAPIPPGLKEREVIVGEGSEWALPGTLTLPSGAGPFPGVVLVHGSGPNDRDERIGPNAPFRDLAIGLAIRGVAVLRYEKRTRFAAAKLKAAQARFTVNEETVADAQAAAGLLARQPEIDAAHTFILGHSLGGMLAPRIASGLKNLGGVIVLAGNARPLEDLIVEQVEYISSLGAGAAGQEQVTAAREAARQIKDPALKADDTISVLGAPTPASYWLDLRGYQPAKVAAALETPFLVLQGGRDYQVTKADFALWQEALANRPNATCKLYPDLNHLFIVGMGRSTPAEYAEAGHVDERVIADVAAWIHAPRKKGR